MRFLHIADLHFGRLLYGRSLIEEQRHFVRCALLPALDEYKPDALLIAGDLYDRQIASIDAIHLFDALIDALCERNIPAVMISGNHDSPDRIAVGKNLLARHGIYIVTTIEEAFTPIEIGGTQIFALPYFENAEMRSYLQDETLRGAGPCMRAAIKKMTAQFNPDKKHVLIAHCFAAGASTSDSESRIFVGGAGDVPTDVFSPFDYAALGHLHAAQKAGDTACYAGSPLKYSVDEAHQKKSMTLVTLADKISAEDRPFEIERIPVTPLHDVKRIEGTFAELTEKGKEAVDYDYVEIILTDEAPVFRPADRLRPYYPNVLSVRSEWFLKQHAGTQDRTTDLRSRSRTELFRSFLKEVCGDEATPEDEQIFEEILKELEGNAT